MKITKEVNLENFEAWSGGKNTLNELTSSECEQLESQLEELYPDGMDETELNDFLWFERDTIAEWLGYSSWERLERAHAGEEPEEHARTIIGKMYPNASDELIDEYIEDEWSDDMEDNTILEEFEEYTNNQNEEEDE